MRSSNTERARSARELSLGRALQHRVHARMFEPMAGTDGVWFESEALDDVAAARAERHASPVRTERGGVPDAIELPVAGPPLLAVGGHEHNTVCVAAGHKAMLSQPIGALDDPDSVARFGEAIGRLVAVTGAVPEVVVHDLHPGYRSTQWARASGLPVMAVQHHHAHVASCLAEHGRTDRVIGIAFDGVGLGDDGTLWGGEILECDLQHSRRLGRLRPLPLAGDAREPWRVAVAALLDAGEPIEVLGRQRGLAQLRTLLATDLPLHASSADVWFDVIAALLRIADDVGGQSAKQLEAIAAPGPATPFDVARQNGEPFEIDLRPAVRELVRELKHETPTPVLAARWHATLAHAVRAACRWVGADTVVLTGSCFHNRRLLEDASRLLEADGFEVLAHRDIPANDGGLALGQAAIASARLSSP